ncbi:MAG: nitroreductase family protein [Candidatus Cloacimonetes bacterium]|nr:nitroreductase family protein [Candidatus Cloacimonadota bacterium]MCF7813480.1 nitroreductase family protein [Candidatus Cloacimonadota bacterium]MCF7868597.1 nitroreductase family protein [Candidatus Cloacimonadota bacterium]MCF7883384.1 nitroreductase family protein [Candidatus Cloacimonadota bacterium]
MEFLDVIKSRKSIRSFAEKDIPEDFLLEILEAARLAPSFQNRQCWRFVVVRDPQKRKELALKSGFLGKVNFFIKTAPVIIVACADTSKSGTVNNQDYYLVDVSIAFQQMMLAAWNRGIGSCWLAAFDEKKVKDILNIPDKIRVVAMSPFGYPKQKQGFYAKAVKTFAGSKKRLEIEKIVKWDEWK